MASARDRSAKILDTVETASEVVAYVALWGTAILVFLQFLFRYFFGIGLPWPDEMARYLHILVVFLCLGRLTREELFIRIDLFRRRLSGKRAEQAFLLIQLVMSVLLMAGGIDLIARIGSLRTPAVHMPLALFFLPAVVGFALVAIESAWKLLFPGFDRSESRGETIDVP
jgi:TRAP-type C4-dicarboxylate transport system permease small subunit